MKPAVSAWEVVDPQLPFSVGVCEHCLRNFFSILGGCIIALHFLQYDDITSLVCEVRNYLSPYITHSHTLSVICIAQNTVSDPGDEWELEPRLLKNQTSRNYGDPFDK